MWENELQHIFHFHGLLEYKLVEPTLEDSLSTSVRERSAIPFPCIYPKGTENLYSHKDL